MAAPTFVAAGAKVSGSATSFTPALPAGIAANDILLLIVNNSSGPALTVSGYTAIGLTTHQGAGSVDAVGTAYLWVGWKRAGSSETAPTVTVGSINHYCSIMVAFRGCETSGNPYSDYGEGSGTAATSTSWGSNAAQWINGGAVTATDGTFNTTKADSLVVQISTQGVDSNTGPGTTATAALLTGFAILTGCNIATNTGVGGSVVVAAGTKATAGSASTTASKISTAHASLKNGQLILAFFPPAPAMPILVADEAFYALSGTAVGLLWGQRAIALPSGSFALTGQSVAFPRGKGMPAVQGSYALSSPSGGAFPSTGCTAYYKLEDLTDSSGGGLTLTNTGGTTFTAGKVNNAALFTGNNFENLNHADNAAYQPGTGNWSYACWVKYTAAYAGFFSYGDTTSHAGYRLGDTAGTAIRARVSDGTNAAEAVNVAAFNDGNWHFIVVTMNRAGNLTLYIDNDAGNTASMTTVTGSLNESGSSQGLSIGRNENGSWFAGSVDEVGTWNRVLTGTEITALWNGGAGTTYSTGGGVNLLWAHKIALIQGAYALTGQLVNLLEAKKIVLTQGAYSLAGQAVTLTKTGISAVLSAVQGAFTLTGQALNLKRTRIMPLVQGAYSLTGQTVPFLRGKAMVIVRGMIQLLPLDVLFKRTYKIAIVQSAYALNGFPQNLIRTRNVPLTQINYALSGQALNLLRSRKVPLTFVAYTLSGQPVALFKTTVGAFTMPITQGAYALTGQPLIFSRSRKIILPQGTYLLNGQPVIFRAGKGVVAAQGLYGVNGQLIGLQVAHKTILLTGNFALTGRPVALARPRILLIGNGVYLLSGHDIILISSASESWIHYANQVTESALIATAATSLLNVFETASSLAVTPAETMSAVSISVASSALKVEKTD
jgi:hypothetical protein